MRGAMEERQSGRLCIARAACGWRGACSGALSPGCLRIEHRRARRGECAHTTPCAVCRRRERERDTRAGDLCAPSSRLVVPRPPLASSFVSMSSGGCRTAAPGAADRERTASEDGGQHEQTQGDDGGAGGQQEQHADDERDQHDRSSALRASAVGDAASSRVRQKKTSQLPDEEVHRFVSSVVPADGSALLCTIVGDSFVKKYKSSFQQLVGVSFASWCKSQDAFVRKQLAGGHWVIARQTTLRMAKDKVASAVEDDALRAADESESDDDEAMRTPRGEESDFNQSDLPSSAGEEESEAEEGLGEEHATAHDSDEDDEGGLRITPCSIDLQLSGRLLTSLLIAVLSLKHTKRRWRRIGCSFFRSSRPPHAIACCKTSTRTVSDRPA
jgi:hypothetical protein